MPDIKHLRISLITVIMIYVFSSHFDARISDVALKPSQSFDGTSSAHAFQARAYGVSQDYTSFLEVKNAIRIF